MRLETNSALRIGELQHARSSRSIWVVYPQGPVRCGVDEFVPNANLSHGRQNGASYPSACGTDKPEVNAGATFLPRHSLCQQSFFVCKLRKVGDIPGTGNIYVEAVVDCDSGTAFAKVYPARNALNALDILVSRVVPFFQNHQITIERISTRKSDEYCGLPLSHPYETFLMVAQIQHLQLDRSGQRVNYVCGNFFQALLRDFFPVVLRKKFDLSLVEIQKELDGFVDAYNQFRANAGLPFPFAMDLTTLSPSEFCLTRDLVVRTRTRPDGPPIFGTLLSLIPGSTFASVAFESAGNPGAVL